MSFVTQRVGGINPFTVTVMKLRPRQDSNLRTRLRRPMLYPLSYEGSFSDTKKEVVPKDGASP